MLEYIILGYLMSKDMSGYDLKLRMASCTSNFFDASFGSIYPALKRLESKNYITLREIVEGGKYKKMYSINEDGRRIFLSWLETPIVFVRTRHDHLVNLFFYDLLPEEKAIANLIDLKNQIETLLNELKGHMSKAEQMPEYKRQYFFQFSTIEYGISYYSFILGWCNDFIKRLEEKPK